MKKNKDTQCIIDTLAIRIHFSNMKNIVVDKQLEYLIKGKSEDIEKGYKKISLNLNKDNENKYRAIEGLKEFKKVFYEVIEQMEIIDKNEIDLTRIDIAIDNNLDFNENFKFLLFVFDLCTFKQSKTDRWYTTNLDTLKYNTIILKNRSLEVVFYDKKEESENKHEYSTRMEFRFKRLSKLDFEKNLDKLIENINKIDEYIEELEIDMGKRLIKFWKKEIENGEVKNFSEFVRKYNRYFYTLGILKIVYKETGLKASHSAWVKDFRKSNKKLEFHTKTNIIKFKKIMIKSIKEYKKS